MAVSKSTTFSESNINIANNTLSLTINIYFSPNNTQTWFEDDVGQGGVGRKLYCTCNGVQKGQMVVLHKGGSVSASFTFDGITGDSTVSYSWNCNTRTSVLGNISDSGAYTVSNIPRYANFSNHYINSYTSSSVTVHWTADTSCDAIQYSLNGGSWTNITGYPNYTVYGLAPGTNYNIRTRIRRTDSGLWTESGYLYFSTFAKTVPSVWLSSKSINSIVVASSCNVSASSVLYRIYSSANGWGSYQSSATFAGLQPNTSYTIEVYAVGRDSGEAGYAYIDVVTYDYARVSANNFNHGDNVAVSFSNASGCEVALCIVDKLTDSVICGYRNASGNSYTFVFSDSELDTMYKKFGNENSRVVRIYVRTYCNGVYYYDYKEVVVTLTGNQKSIHIYINGLKNAKTFIGYNAQVRRGVWWIGDANKNPRRCI